MPTELESTPAAVVAKAFSYDRWHDQYQQYYRTGLRLHLKDRGQDLRLLSRSQHPTVLKFLRRIHDASSLRGLLRSQSAPVEDYLDWLAQRVGAQHRPTASLVGEYLFWLHNGRSATLCIDSHDSGVVNSPSLLEHCDVYLKTNYWPDKDYDPRVRPFFNCNPMVLPYLERLRAMRGRPPAFDLCFIVRVWGGKTGREGIEHCLRLLEAVAKVRAKKFLLAELMIGDTAAQERRLRLNGIPTTTRRFDLKQMWEVTARSWLNISRLGNHHSLSWRMTDLLALGACTVLDQEPKTVWPTPLVSDQHYYSMNATTSDAEPLAHASDYAAIPELIEELLANKDVLQAMRRRSGEFFDDHLHPLQIGRRIHEILYTHVPGRVKDAATLHVPEAQQQVVS